MQDLSNGYQAIAETFIVSRSRIGASRVRDWAQALPGGASVLDLGCGYGVPVTETLLEAGLQVHAVDASATLVEAFRARFPDVPVACEPVEASTFFDRTYDGVIAWGLLFLLAPATQRLVIAKVARAMKAGGSFLFTAPAETCTWTDALTGQPSTSLGAVAYRDILASHGLIVQEEVDDEGGNHYYVATTRIVGDLGPRIADRGSGTGVARSGTSNVRATYPFGMLERNLAFATGRRGVAARRILRIALIGIVGWSAAVSAGVRRHDVDLERYRELGRRAEFDSVGRYAEGRTSEDYAAGVLVAPTWVLTAAHFPTDVGVWRFGNELFETKRIVRHPRLVPDAQEQQWTGWDLALIELDRPVTAVTPAARYRGNAEVGKLVTKIGYGYQGDGLNGLTMPPIAERLGGHNIIEAAGGTYEGRSFSSDVLVFDFDSPLSAEKNRFGSASPVELEIGGAKGDSGGGVFAQEAGQWQLLGIVSGGLNREIRYGSVAALARVSAANSWIDSVISHTATSR